MNKVGRNESCPCGSGKKYKHCCGSLLTSNPQSTALDVSAVLARGLEFHRSGQFQNAEIMYKNVLDMEPDNADALHLLGALAIEFGKYDVAIELIAKAIGHKPSAVMYYNLGMAYHRLARVDLALANYQSAVMLEANWSEAHNNVGVALLDNGLTEEATKSFQKALAANPQNVEAFSNYLLSCQYSPTYSVRAMLADHQEFSKRFEVPLMSEWSRFRVPEDRESKLRVGFVSGDFRGHPVGYFLEAVLQNMACDAVDIYLYSTNPASDALTARLQHLPVQWRPLHGLSDAEAASRIRGDGINILVDLAGHTAHNRLLIFARKPAPIQVSWLGYAATTGLKAIDYVLCDEHSVHIDEADQFVETPWRLPSTRLCFTAPANAIEVGPLPALKNGYITFACFNNLAKINDLVFETWARILSSLPESRLLLKSRQYDNPSCRLYVTDKFAAQGIAAQRLQFEGFSTRDEYLNVYQRADLALDPFPFPGGATSVEGLWMGVPMVTLQGDRLVGRQGSSIMTNLGLHDWIAQDLESYIRVAQQRTTDISALSVLRASLRARLLASPLFDAKDFAKHLEAALRAMWSRFIVAQGQQSVSL